MSAGVLGRQQDRRSRRQRPALIGGWGEVVEGCHGRESRDLPAQHPGQPFDFSERDHQPRSGVRQNADLSLGVFGDAIGAKRRVDGHRDGAGQQRPEERGEEGFLGAEHDRDRIAPTDPPGAQRRRHVHRASPQPGVGQRLLCAVFLTQKDVCAGPGTSGPASAARRAASPPTMVRGWRPQPAPAPTAVSRRPPVRLRRPPAPGRPACRPPPSRCLRVARRPRVQCGSAAQPVRVSLSRARVRASRQGRCWRWSSPVSTRRPVVRQAGRCGVRGRRGRPGRGWGASSERPPRLPQ